MHCGCREMLGDGTPSLQLQTNRPLVICPDRIWPWYKKASERWGAVCDWVARRINSLSEAGPNDIVNVVSWANLGRGGVLADQELPYRGGKVLNMRINTQIEWEESDGPLGRTIDPVRTICHEIGHLQGHMHWPVGAPLELMEPSISNTIISPQPTEAKVSRGWFGTVPEGPEKPKGKIRINLGIVEAEIL